MKKSRIIIIISVAVLLLALCYSYYKFEYNEITDTYDWITLRNIYSELDDFLDTYEKQYQNQSVYEFEIKNNLLLKKYFNQIHTYEWYLSLSPRLSSVSYYIGRIANMNDGGISKKELVYVIYVRDSLKMYIDKINDELEEISIRRMFGIFRKSNVAELEDIFNDTFPNSGMIVRYFPFMGFNTDGSSNVERGDIPDVYTEEDALKVCLELIRKEN